MQSPTNKPLINFIPDFLEYCKKEKHFLPKSIENYYKFLNRFIIYLKHSGQSHLLPHELSSEYIQSYKAYLSKQISHETKQSISKSTQNVYLIALRALLFYFAEKNIPSLLPDKIRLLKQDKPQSENKFLNSEQLERFLQSPNTSNHIGLRDKVILEILLSTGLKVGQLVALDRDQIKLKSKIKNIEIRISDIKGIYPRIVCLSKKATYWLKKYLDNRDDNDKALFINYKKGSQKSSSRRLTPRSIENIVKKYITDNNLPSFLTPETLRNVYIFHLLNRDMKITTPLTHKVFTVKDYNMKLSTMSYYSTKEKTKSPTWHAVENVLNKEISWLKKKISIMPYKYRSNRLLQNCDDCLFRKLAILIVSGKIKATEFRPKNRKDLWNNIIGKKVNRHGKEWHRKMMGVVSEYFKKQNYKVILEPTLNYGRADLEVYLNSKNATYIEIGTVSLFKLWYNLSTMRNVTFLIVPFEEYAIEFKT